MLFLETEMSDSGLIVDKKGTCRLRGLAIVPIVGFRDLGEQRDGWETNKDYNYEWLIYWKLLWLVSRIIVKLFLPLPIRVSLLLRHSYFYGTSVHVESDGSEDSLELIHITMIRRRGRQIRGCRMPPEDFIGMYSGTSMTVMSLHYGI